MTTVEQPKLPLVPSGPEALFGVDDVQVEGSEITAQMPTGPWLAGADGQACAGSVGVLLDDVLGYALILGHSQTRWAVSAEIAIDLVGDLPLTPGLLRGRGRAVASDDRTALSLATLTDPAGTVLAHARQRGRYIERGDIGSTPFDPTTVADPDRSGDVQALVIADESTSFCEDGLDLTVPLRLGNEFGSLHGGITICLSDWVAARLLTDGGPPLRTASIHVAFVRPVPVGRGFRLRASAQHRGRGFAVVHVVGSLDDGSVCTIATVTAH